MQIAAEAVKTARESGRLAPESQASSGNRQPTIAVLDDDPSVLRALARLIRSRGGVAQAFSSPAQLIESASQTPPDCLILDVQMPAMSGLEVHERLLERGCKFPVVFITAHEDPQAEAQALRSGAAAFFYKPFRTQALWDAVVRVLGTGS